MMRNAPKRTKLRENPGVKKNRRFLPTMALARAPMEIRTKRLVLREFTTADIPAVDAYHSHPEYRRFLPWEEASQSKATEFVTRCIAMAGAERRVGHQLAITLQDGTLIGSSGLKINIAHPYEAHFACELAPAHLGKGYGRETCHAMIDCGFSELGLHRVYSQVVAEHRAAVRMLINVGMQREGLFRENRFFNGHWWDTLSYGLIARDWKTAEETRPPA